MWDICVGMPGHDRFILFKIQNTFGRKEKSATEKRGFFQKL